jgi:hypothetical protein
MVSEDTFEDRRTGIGSHAAALHLSVEPARHLLHHHPWYTSQFRST